jgi:tetratricopeptide (TPR) repeat protein
MFHSTIHAILLGALLLATLSAAAAPPPEGRDLLAEARRLRDSGEIAASASAYLQYLKEQPDSWLVRYEFSRLLISMRELNAAEQQLQQALLLSPKRPSLWARLGQVYLLKENLELAERALLRAKNLAPGEPGVRFNLGLMYEKQGRDREALAEYLAFLEIGGEGPRIVTVTRKVAQYYEVEGPLEEALIHYRSLVQLAPDKPWPHKQLADLFYRMARHDEALEEYLIVLKMDPENTAAHFNVGFIAKLRGRLEEAEREMEIAVSLQPDSAKSLYHLGAIRYERANFEGAVQSFEKAIAAEPDHVQAYYHYARALMKLGRREEALRALEIHKEILRKRKEEHPSKTMDRPTEVD